MGAGDGVLDPRPASRSLPLQHVKKKLLVLGRVEGPKRIQDLRAAATAWHSAERHDAKGGTKLGRGWNRRRGSASHAATPLRSVVRVEEAPSVDDEAITRTPRQIPIEVGLPKVETSSNSTQRRMVLVSLMYRLASIHILLRQAWGAGVDRSAEEQNFLATEATRVQDTLRSLEKCDPAKFTDHFWEMVGTVTERAEELMTKKPSDHFQHDVSFIPPEFVAEMAQERKGSKYLASGLRCSPLTAIRTAVPVTCVVIHPESANTVFVGRKDGKVLRVSLTEKTSCEIPMGMYYEVTALVCGRLRKRRDCTDEDLYLAAGGADKTVRLWNVTQSKLQYIFTDHKGAISCLVIWLGQLVSSGYDGGVRLWDISRNCCSGILSVLSQPSHLPAPKGTGKPDAVMILSPVGQLLLAGYRSGAVGIYILCNPQASAESFGMMELRVGTFFAPRAPRGVSRPVLRAWGEAELPEAHLGPVRALAMDSSLNSVLFSGGDDMLIMQWSLDTNSRKNVFRGHTAAVTALQLITTSLLVSGSEDTWLILWDVDHVVQLQVVKSLGCPLVATLILPHAFRYPNEETGVTWPTAAATALRRRSSVVGMTSRPSLSISESKRKFSVAGTWLLGMRATKRVSGVQVWPELLTVTADEGLQIWSIAEDPKKGPPRKAATRSLAVLQRSIHDMSATGIPAADMSRGDSMPYRPSAVVFAASVDSNPESPVQPRASLRNPPSSILKPQSPTSPA